MENLTQNLIEKINKKHAQVAKLKAKLQKSLNDCSDAEYEAIIFFVETGDRNPYRAYLKQNNLYYGGDAWRYANDYYDAVNCLTKYEKQLKAEEDKNATLSELPEVIIQFKNNLIDHWDAYDNWKLEQIKIEYREAEKLPLSEYREAIKNIIEKWGRGWRDFYYLTSEKIHENNVKDANNLVLNLINRVIEKTGKITDADNLHLDSDNSGYTIINGVIIGENGSARVESIGAGGYNIQRYHIRVLVK